MVNVFAVNKPYIIISPLEQAINEPFEANLETQLDSISSRQ